jgi:hypothetical protein
VRGQLDVVQQPEGGPGGGLVHQADLARAPGQRRWQGRHRFGREPALAQVQGHLARQDDRLGVERPEQLARQQLFDRRLGPGHVHPTVRVAYRPGG